ncbi:MAG: LysR family transcriptional regulator [Hyphomonadaceae bacterium]|jgi:DNA-binding transcriptional LysR family regulator|nr:LysR family transcriptional regulator [Hyphomonadaceae bacterium]
MNFLDHSSPDPPLRAVRAFEATARLGTMAAAAEELAVSPSAISHQLSLLENFLQLVLLRRSGRGIQLTEDGKRYYRSVRSAFAVLRDATAEMRERTAPVEIKISAIPLFAMGWLIPRLPDFIRMNPGIHLNVSYANHQNYSSDPADLSVRFGGGTFQGYEAKKIASGNSVPVCSAAFLRSRGPFDSVASILEEPLIHDQDRSSWRLWFEACGIQTSVTRPGDVIFEDGLLTTAATLAGLGIALLRRALIEAEIESGALVQLFEPELDDGRHYYLCSRADIELSEPELHLSNWLMSLASSNDG